MAAHGHRAYIEPHQTKLTLDTELESRFTRESFFKTLTLTEIRLS